MPRSKQDPLDKLFMEYRTLTPDQRAIFERMIRLDILSLTPRQQKVKVKAATAAPAPINRVAPFDMPF